MSRRVFLASATSASLAPFLGAGMRSAWASWAVQDAPLVPPVPMSIGYLEGSDTQPGTGLRGWLDSSEQRRVVPAGSLGVTDTDPAGWVLVTVHGIYPSAGVLGRDVDGILVDVDFRASEADPELRFFAWTLRTGRAPSGGGRSVFQVPVESGLTFHLTTRSAGREESSSRRLGPTARTGTPRLRRGAYLLATRPGTWDRPRPAPMAGDPAWAGLASILVTVDPA
jgi:hypothetical protein